MTAAQMRVAARLLNTAADRFSNHGCNDLGFKLGDVFPATRRNVW